LEIEGLFYKFSNSGVTDSLLRYVSPRLVPEWKKYADKWESPKRHFFNWKKKYGGLGVPELRKLRQLEEENAQLKKLVADLSLDKQMLQDVVKKVVKPAYKKEMACWMVSNYRISVQRACRCVCLARSM